MKSYEIHLDGWNPLPLKIIDLIPKAIPDNRKQCFNNIDLNNDIRRCYNYNSCGNKFDKHLGYTGKIPGNPHNYYICPKCFKKYNGKIIFKKCY